MNGSLSEFTLAQILQFFAIAERTGMVIVRTAAKESRLLVEGDRIAGWGFDDLDVQAQLLACDLLPESIAEELSSVVRREDTPGLSFVVRNLVEPGRWDAFSQRVLEQDIYPLMNADEGAFEVTIGRCPPAPCPNQFTHPRQLALGIRDGGGSSRGDHDREPMETGNRNS